jgi:hypothetical protein
MKSTPRERGDATVAMLTVPTIQRIVEIMLDRFPMDSEIAKEIFASFTAKEPISDQVIDAIILTIEEEPGLSNYTFKDISDNEIGLVPYYVKQLLKKKAAEDVRQKARDV